MGAGGTIDSLRQIADRLGLARFDQRPGELEATRGLKLPPALVYGRRGEDGWQVVLQSPGAELVPLTPAEARKLADELVTMAGWIEGKP